MFRHQLPQATQPTPNPNPLALPPTPPFSKGHGGLAENGACGAVASSNVYRAASATFNTDDKGTRAVFEK